MAPTGGPPSSRLPSPNPSPVAPHGLCVNSVSPVVLHDSPTVLTLSSSADRLSFVSSVDSSVEEAFDATLSFLVDVLSALSESFRSGEGSFDDSDRPLSVLSLRLGRPLRVLLLLPLHWPRMREPKLFRPPLGGVSGSASDTVSTVMPGESGKRLLSLIERLRDAFSILKRSPELTIDFIRRESLGRLMLATAKRRRRTSMARAKPQKVASFAWLPMVLITESASSAFSRACSLRPSRRWQTASMPQALDIAFVDRR
mmetsp:Transcript_61767/g.137652  ORF Transcript_61767/g.137652 Transcript_61767/m.137652 type:complete len:257 (-) Transcript_61767:1331-2101(-)